GCGLRPGVGGPFHVLVCDRPAGPGKEVPSDAGGVDAERGLVVRGHPGGTGSRMPYVERSPQVAEVASPDVCWPRHSAAAATRTSVRRVGTRGRGTATRLGGAR